MGTDTGNTNYGMRNSWQASKFGNFKSLFPLVILVLGNGSSESDCEHSEPRLNVAQMWSPSNLNTVTCLERLLRHTLCVGPDRDNRAQVPPTYHSTNTNTLASHNVCEKRP